MLRRILRGTGLCVALALLTAAEPARGTLDSFADAVVERARPHLAPARDLDVAVSVAGPWPRLGDDLAALVIARLRTLGLRSVARGDGDAAWARAAGYERLVRLDLDVGGGRLRASGSVLALTTSPWAAGTETRAHLYVETPLDAELRAYLPAVTTPPGRWQARGVPVGDVDLLALDVGDTDGDGRAEVVGVTASEAIVWAWDGARLNERRRVPLVGRSAATMPRAAVGSVVVDGGAIVAHASPFADGVRMVAGNRRARSESAPVRGFQFPGVAASCELAPGVDWFAASGCVPSAGLPERFWTVAGLRGGARAARAAIDPAGTLWVVLGAAATAPALPLTVRGVGAQVALVALDRGEFVATSEPVQPGEADAIVVRALTAGLPVAYRVDRLPGNVRALAAGDVDNDGKAELVAAVRDRAARRTELWMVN
ncbi:MAG: hypothetical protein ACXVAN_10780 [Polyangia bacterium]